MMARPITTVLCDLDGTLIDSRRDIALAFQYALRRIVEGAPPDETAIAQHIGKPLEHMARELGYPLVSPTDDLSRHVSLPLRRLLRSPYASLSWRDRDPARYHL